MPPKKTTPEATSGVPTSGRPTPQASNNPPARPAQTGNNQTPSGQAQAGSSDQGRTSDPASHHGSEQRQTGNEPGTGNQPPSTKLTMIEFDFESSAQYTNAGVTQPESNVRTQLTPPDGWNETGRLRALDASLVDAKPGSDGFPLFTKVPSIYRSTKEPEENAYRTVDDRHNLWAKTICNVVDTAKSIHWALHVLQLIMKKYNCQMPPQWTQIHNDVAAKARKWQSIRPRSAHAVWKMKQKQFTTVVQVFGASREGVLDSSFDLAKPDEQKAFMEKARLIFERQWEKAQVLKSWIETHNKNPAKDPLPGQTVWDTWLVTVEPVPLQ